MASSTSEQETEDEIEPKSQREPLAIECKLSFKDHMANLQNICTVLYDTYIVKIYW